MVRQKLFSGALVCLLVTVAFAQRGGARRNSSPKGAVCGDPTARCQTSYSFRPYDLPFRIPARAVIWESEPFYAVILKNVTNKDCEAFVSEAERLETQALFPHNKA